MTVRTKIFIDKYAGYPIVLILNAILFLKRRTKNKRNSDAKNIIICKFMGLGSIIQSTPMIKSIRLKYPYSKITFLTTAKNYELLKQFPFIDSIVTINEKNFLLFSLTTLQALKYLLINHISIFIDLEIYSFYSKMFSAVSNADNTIGYYRKGKPLKGIYSTSVYFDINQPVKKLYLEAARFAGCEILNDELDGFSNIIYNEHSYAASNNSNENVLGNELKSIKNYIVLNPNASELRSERRWPSSNYIDLINRLLADHPDLKIVLTGSFDEKNYVSDIYNAVNGNFRNKVINTAGYLSLRDFINLIYKSCLVITNDSGPMHIAFALKKKTIALFGPCSPAGYITQVNVELVYRKIYCSPCVHDYSISPCKGNNQCMKLISVSEIMDIFNRIMIDNLVENPINSAC